MGVPQTMGVLLAMLCLQPNLEAVLSPSAIEESTEFTEIQKPDFTAVSYSEEASNTKNICDQDIEDNCCLFDDCYEPCLNYDEAASSCFDSPVVYTCFENQLQIGGNYTYVHLKPNGLSSFSGNLGGLQLIYDHFSPCGFYGGGKVAWRGGSTCGDAGNRSLTYVDVIEKLGYTFCLPLCCDRWAVTAFSGFGYRFLDEVLTPTDSPSLRFRYHEFYVPLGFASNFCLNAFTSLGICLTWMPQVFPTVTIAPLDGARWVLKKEVSNFLLELPLTFKPRVHPCISLSVTPFYEHWNDGPSTATTTTGMGLGLPGNSYNFVGMNLNVIYSF